MTNADGQYNFNIGADAASRHSVLVSVPESAVDQDTGLQWAWPSS